MGAPEPEHAEHISLHFKHGQKLCCFQTIRSSCNPGAKGGSNTGLATPAASSMRAGNVKRKGTPLLPASSSTREADNGGGDLDLERLLPDHNSFGVEVGSRF